MLPSILDAQFGTPYPRSTGFYTDKERAVAKVRSAFYQQQARRYQSREVRAKTYNVGELILCLPEKKKDKLKPKWEGLFIIDEVLT